ncbi:hypothetical protein FHY22_003825 [Xanthomonas arboricola]|jgi:hypothetical protein|nr:hypothetical protein [Xanthomonas arboricola]MBB5859379.1 hypothetical protein [Xanthomonas arboricola]SOU02371.1 hypothetical protein CFBP6773_03293 [Xanthomonas arboricola pv. fragariae]
MVGWVTSGLLAFSRSMAVLRCTPSQPARPCPGPRLRRGRSKARAPSCPSSSLRERCLKASLSFFETFSGHGNNVQSGSVAGDWRRAAHGCAAAASQTGCLPSRGADPRPRCRPHRSDYRQASCFAVPSPHPLLPVGDRRPILPRGRSAERTPVARKLRLLARRESDWSICHELSVANCQCQRTPLAINVVRLHAVVLYPVVPAR